MNDAEMLAAMQAGYQTVEVRFLSDNWTHPSGQPQFQEKMYAYKVPTAWNVQEGDWLIVLPGNAFKTVRVFSVSDLPESLGHNGRPLKWAVQKVDPTFYFNIDTVERQMLQHVRAAQLRREREALLAEMRNTVGSAVDESMRAFANLLGGQPPETPQVSAAVAPQATAAAAPATSLNFDASKVTPEQAEANRAAQEGLTAAREQEAANAAPLPQGIKPSWTQ